MEKTVLVTGGAGYIGSIAVKELISKGYHVIVVDNLSKGLRKLVHPDAEFYRIDLVDKGKLARVFRKNIDAVMHFAAYKAVEESMANPAKYCDNITGTINLLSLMVEHGVNKLIYSSSAAVYGSPKYNPIDEKHPAEPVNFYGFTKLECERLIEWYSKLHKISYVCLRYFNVAGDGGLGYVDPDAKNIMPILMEVIMGKRKKLSIFGNDYDTRDGSCIRDYVDVNDLIRAHILALGLKGSAVINLGTSSGVSVKELVQAAFEVTGKKIELEYSARRPGDPAALVASNDKARKLLKWKPEKSIKHMIASTYEAYMKNRSH